MKKKLLSLTLFLSVVFITNAQNFSGHYTIQSKEMVKGKEYLNAIPQEITVVQTKDSIKIIQVIPGGEAATETLPVNGHEVITITAKKRKKTASILFDNLKGSAKITLTFSYPDRHNLIEYLFTELWTYNNDNTLTITKTSDATETDDWTLKANFKKD